MGRQGVQSLSNLALQFGVELIARGLLRAERQQLPLLLLNDTLLREPLSLSLFFFKVEQHLLLVADDAARLLHRIVLADERDNQPEGKQDNHQRCPNDDCAAAESQRKVLVASLEPTGVVSHKQLLQLGVVDVGLHRVAQRFIVQNVAQCRNRVGKIEMDVGNLRKSVDFCGSRQFGEYAASLANISHRHWAVALRHTQKSHIEIHLRQRIRLDARLRNLQSLAEIAFRRLVVALLEIEVGNVDIRRRQCIRIVVPQFESAVVGIQSLSIALCSGIDDAEIVEDAHP